MQRDLELTKNDGNLIYSRGGISQLRQNFDQTNFIISISRRT